jgi:hypothetical protein
VNKGPFRVPFGLCDATSPSWTVALARTFTNLGPKNVDALPTPLGSLRHPQDTPQRTPFRDSGIRTSRIREPCDTVLVRPNAETPSADGQRSTLRVSGISLSGYRDPRCQYFVLSNPRVPRCRFSATTPPVFHYSAGSHSTTSLRDFADRGSTTQVAMVLETPNADPAMLRIRATCPSNDRRLRLNGKSQLAISTCM